MNTGRETFHKSERLCSRKIITFLFDSGNVFYSKLFKIVWSKSPVPISSPSQVAFSVTKKSFRLAVTRNLIKRRMREAYRRNKYILYDFLCSENIKIVFIVIYKEDSVMDFREIEISVKEMIDRLIDSIKK
ncbi:MAG: ribonuclease P protein component [Bacteroidia bacterium]|nr:ribonuclease P protein component [Bacteroidia bacterium]